MHAEIVRPNGLLHYLLPVAIFIVIFAVRARRMSQLRPFRIGQLWIVPTIYLAIVVAMFVANPPTAAGWLVALIALAIGVAIGWQRGRMMTLHVDPLTGMLMQKGSMLAVLFLLAIVGLKVAAQNEGPRLGFDVALVTDGALALALGMFTATRIEMYLRGKRLLAGARSA